MTKKPVFTKMDARDDRYQIPPLARTQASQTLQTRRT